MSSGFHPRARLPIDPFAASNGGPPTSWIADTAVPYVPADDELHLEPRVILMFGEPTLADLLPLLTSPHLSQSLILLASHVSPALPADYASASASAMPAFRFLRLPYPLSIHDAGAVRLVSVLERASRLAKLWRRAHGRTKIANIFQLTTPPDNPEGEFSVVEPFVFRSTDPSLAAEPVFPSPTSVPYPSPSSSATSLEYNPSEKKKRRFTSFFKSTASTSNPSAKKLHRTSAALSNLLSNELQRDDASPFAYSGTSSPTHSSFHPPKYHSAPSIPSSPNFTFPSSDTEPSSHRAFDAVINFLPAASFVQNKLIQLEDKHLLKHVILVTTLSAPFLASPSSHDRPNESPMKPPHQYHYRRKLSTSSNPAFLQVPASPQGSVSSHNETRKIKRDLTQRISHTFVGRSPPPATQALSSSHDPHASLPLAPALSLRTPFTLAGSKPTNANAHIVHVLPRGWVGAEGLPSVQKRSGFPTQKPVLAHSIEHFLINFAFSSLQQTATGSGRVAPYVLAPGLFGALARVVEDKKRQVPYPAIPPTTGLAILLGLLDSEFQDWWSGTWSRRGARSAKGSGGGRVYVGGEGKSANGGGEGEKDAKPTLLDGVDTSLDTPTPTPKPGTLHEGEGTAGLPSPPQSQRSSSSGHNNLGLREGQSSSSSEDEREGCEEEEKVQLVADSTHEKEIVVSPIPTHRPSQPILNPQPQKPAPVLSTSSSKQTLRLLNSSNSSSSSTTNSRASSPPSSYPDAYLRRGLKSWSSPNLGKAKANLNGTTPIPIPIPVARYPIEDKELKSRGAGAGSIREPEKAYQPGMSVGSASAGAIRVGPSTSSTSSSPNNANTSSDPSSPNSPTITIRPPPKPDIPISASTTDLIASLNERNHLDGNLGVKLNLGSGSNNQLGANRGWDALAPPPRGAPFSSNELGGGGGGGGASFSLKGSRSDSYLPLKEKAMQQKEKERALVALLDQANANNNNESQRGRTRKQSFGLSVAFGTYEERESSGINDDPTTTATTSKNASAGAFGSGKIGFDVDDWCGEGARGAVVAQKQKQEQESQSQNPNQSPSQSQNQNQRRVLVSRTRSTKRRTSVGGFGANELKKNFEVVNVSMSVGRDSANTNAKVGKRGFWRKLGLGFRGTTSSAAAKA